MSRKDLIINTCDLIKFSYIFDPENFYFGLVCEVKKCYNFKNMIKILEDKNCKNTPLTMINIIEKYSYD